MKTVSIVLFAGMAACATAQPVSTVDAAAFREKVLHSFSGGADGTNPAAGLIHVKGTLYGTASNGGGGWGTVFALDRRTGTENVLYSFCSRQNCTDGAVPWAGLIDEGGNLYGTTVYGGSHNGGTVFAVDATTGAETVVYAFPYDGSDPITGLIDVNGILYGTTGGGGGSGHGMVFALDPKTGTLTMVYSFCHQPHCTDGKDPGSGLIDVNGTLYGTTAAGGADYTGCGNAGCGTVYSVDPGTGTETVLYSFVGDTDGESPNGVIAVNGILYGTTLVGGTTCYDGASCGTVFSVDLGTGAETVLHTFGGGSDGARPSAGLIDVGGMLYGTTQLGGAKGTAFSLDPTSGAETVLHKFGFGSDGATPYASLIAVNGKFYGTTYAGGAYGDGTVFELKQKP